MNLYIFIISVVRPAGTRNPPEIRGCGCKNAPAGLLAGGFFPIPQVCLWADFRQTRTGGCHPCQKVGLRTLSSGWMDTTSSSGLCSWKGSNEAFCWSERGDIHLRSSGLGLTLAFAASCEPSRPMTLEMSTISRTRMCFIVYIINDQLWQLTSHYTESIVLKATSYSSSRNARYFHVTNDQSNFKKIRPPNSKDL